jgi:hypothetical protein
MIVKKYQIYFGEGNLRSFCWLDLLIRSSIIVARTGERITDCFIVTRLYGQQTTESSVEVIGKTAEMDW